jgi:hypothetical protein
MNEGCLLQITKKHVNVAKIIWQDLYLQRSRAIFSAPFAVGGAPEAHK